MSQQREAHKTALTVDEAQLRQLARELGVGTEYWGFDGNLHDVSTQTLVKVLAALGWQVSSDADLARVRTERELNEWRRVLPPSLIARTGVDFSFPVHVPDGTGLEVLIHTEDGRTVGAWQGEDFTPAREVDGVWRGRARFHLPKDLPLGWHEVEARTVEGSFRCTLAVVPHRVDVQDRLAGKQAWGLQAQLYSVRSQRSWGVGDFSDLRDLCTLAGARYGADFTLINPLHAAEPIPPVEASPYLPTTRRFVNPLYIRVEDIPEYSYLPGSDIAQIRSLQEALAADNSNPQRIDRDASLEAKIEALDIVYSAGLSPAREAAFEAFCKAEGEGLELFALWCVLTEMHADATGPWAKAYLDPHSPETRRLLIESADRVRYYCWLQWVLDEQLASAQRAALASGMRIGIVHDLAVGVHSAGSDSWSLGDALARGVHVGAPADQYNQQGQNWHQPPWRPNALAEAGYRPWRDMLRTLMRHAGALRIDHILGLFRLWWIPEGQLASEGTYVFYDHEAMIGVLALEAQRAGCIIVGEDLGTFEPWVRDYLSDRGILGTSILWFENDADGPIPPERYRRLCMASVNTHDLPPTAGYLAGEHVKLRDKLGLLERSLAEEIAADREAQEKVLSRLRERGLLKEGASQEETLRALHAYLAASDSLLLGVSLVDCVGEYRIQNQPGTDKEYPNWMVPLADGDGKAVMLEDLTDNDLMASLAQTVNDALAAKQR
ncbi:4-alpha-glucanotransferase [Dermabacteraceae bacterium P13077]